MSAAELDRCGCFEPFERDERALFNRPGLPSLAYRLATHSEFLRSMVAALPSHEVVLGDGVVRPLERLGARASDDAAIALLDAWALVADVLTFYQERIANEGYLRTATERASVLELARAIGYELDPGVAAATYLAFTIEDAPGAPDAADVPAGVKVQSIPGQGQRPQTFETTEGIDARAEWNVLLPRPTEPQRIARGVTELYLEGVDTQLSAGDALLLVGDHRDASPGSERWDVRILRAVDVDRDAGRTVVRWDTPLGHEAPTIDPADNPRAYAFRVRASLFGHNAPDFLAMPDSVKYAYAPEAFTGDPPTFDRRFRQWPGFELTSGDDPEIDLDAVYPKVLPGTWIALTKPGYTELYKVVSASPSSRTDFTITSKTTKLRLDAREHLSWFSLRQTLVYAQSEELAIAETPIPAAVGGDRIELDRTVSGLRRDHAIVVEGRAQGAAPDDDAIAEAAVVARTEESDGRTTLVLARPLTASFERASVRIYANVAPATHGETVHEVLGSGDGARPHQRFTLRKPPLTHVAAPTATGSRSELVVRVDGVEWEQVPSLFGLAPDARAYTVRVDDDAAATVLFGDGGSGARLPTGSENVTATYRSGLGPEGAVDAGSVSLLQTRPLGVRSVTNPVRASGAAAPEALEDARANAPLTVLTLDRIVSLRDYEDYARAFAGIGKAQAVELWDGEKRFVHITVAASDGTAVDAGGALHVNLLAGVDAARDAVHPVQVESFRPLSFALRARVLVDSAYEFESVLESVRTRVADTFSFARRQFGQPVTRAEVTTCVQATEGVVATTVDELCVVGAGGPVLSERLPAARADRGDDGVVRAAQLLLVDAAGIVLERMPQ